MDASRGGAGRPMPCLALLCVALAMPRIGAFSAKPALPPAFSAGSDDRYAEWRVDVGALDASRGDPAVVVGESPGAGHGVFAARRVAAGETLTEWVGCIAPTPETRFGELELQQEFYGEGWRDFSQRYEIGLSGSVIVDAGGSSVGGVEDHVVHADEFCAVDEGMAACVARAGEMDYLLLGKTREMGACAREGVAQLINDHSAILAGAEGLVGDVDGLLVTEGSVPVAAARLALGAAVDAYIANIGPGNNVALVQARTGLGTGIAAPRVFAVATRPIAAGDELRYTYGVEWWLSQLRRAALAQLVSCRPSAARAAALADVIRCIEQTSAEKLDAQARAVGRAGSMPRGFVTPIEPLPPLDDLIAGEDNWKKALLIEEFATATECPVEELYAETFAPSP